jgi:Fic family protein
MPIDPGKYLRLEVPIPVRHRRKVPFSPRIAVASPVEARLRRIQRLDSDLSQFVVSRPEFEERIQDVVSSNLFSSIRLEGNPLTQEQVREAARDSLQGRTRIPRSPPRREVVNQLGVWLLPGELGTPWSMQTLTRLHRTLMEGVDPKARPGRLRTQPSGVYSDRGEELFVTCPPEHIRGELESLLRWLNEESAAMSPVVAAAIFFHEFESIHPFSEGNGRCGRILLHCYLQNHGLDCAYRTRMEVEALRSAEAYYKVLGWTDYSGNYSVLIDYLSEAAEVAYEEATGWFRDHDLAGTLHPAARQLLARAFAERNWFNLRTASRWLPSRSEQTVRSHLNKMRSLSLLETRGRTRALQYRFSDPLADLRAGAARIRESLVPQSLPTTRSRRSMKVKSSGRSGD